MFWDWLLYTCALYLHPQASISAIYIESSNNFVMNNYYSSNTLTRSTREIVEECVLQLRALRLRSSDVSVIQTLFSVPGGE